MDYDFLSASNGSGDAALMHVESIRLSGATTIDVDTIVNVPTKFIATYGTLGSDGLITAASKRDFKGHTDAGNLIIDGFMPGSVDNGNTVGQVVIIKPNTHWTDTIATFIKNLKNLGTPEPITASTVTATSVATSGAVTAGNGLAVTAGTVSVPAGSVTPAAITGGDANMLSAWQTWSPTLGGLTLGNGTVIAKYRKIGKTVHVFFSFEFGNTSDVTGEVTFTLPVTAASHYAGWHALGIANFHDAGSTIRPGYTLIGDSTLVRIRWWNISGINIFGDTWTTTAPFDTAPDDEFTTSFTYEAA